MKTRILSIFLEVLYKKVNKKNISSAKMILTRFKDLIK